MERMRRASAEGKEQGTAEGTRVAQEMLRDALGMIQGVQVSARWPRQRECKDAASVPLRFTVVRR